MQISDVQDYLLCDPWGVVIHKLRTTALDGCSCKYLDTYKQIMTKALGFSETESMGQSPFPVWELLVISGNWFSLSNSCSKSAWKRRQLRKPSSAPIKLNTQITGSLSNIICKTVSGTFYWTWALEDRGYRCPISQFLSTAEHASTFNGSSSGYPKIAFVG